MTAVVLRPVCLLVFAFLVGKSFCSINHGFQHETENDVEEFWMPSNEGNEEEDSLYTGDKTPNISRVVTTLSVKNGGPWGDWGPAQFCEEGSYAVGYDMKIERKKILDNTALNAIKLICEFPDGKSAGDISSTIGHWGSWVGPVKCQPRVREHLYLTSFDLQVQERRHLRDDTAANYVKFKCRDMCGSQKPIDLVKPPGHGHWGTWGSWSDECPIHTAICGIKTRVEKPQGKIRDDTALNDVKFYCCQ